MVTGENMEEDIANVLVPGESTLTGESLVSVGSVVTKGCNACV